MYSENTLPWRGDATEEVSGFTHSEGEEISLVMAPKGVEGQGLKPYRQTPPIMGALSMCCILIVLFLCRMLSILWAQRVTWSQNTRS